MKNKLPTIKIKNKDYVLVSERVLAFNEMYPQGSIVTEIVKNDDRSVVVKATVCPDRKEVRLFTGHSEAYREGNMGNVPVEVAETSAVGRALGMMGIGIVNGIASADEIVKATGTSRLATQKQKDYIQKMLVNKGLNFLTDKELETLTMDEASKLIEKYKFRPKHYGANDRDFTADEEGGDKYEAIKEANEIIINQE